MYKSVKMENSRKWGCFSLLIPIEVYSFLLNFTFIIILYFVYGNYMQGKILSKYSNQLVIAFISLISIISCMTFSLPVVPGLIIDMRMIPFLIGSFYGGRKVSLLLLIAMLSYRFYLGEFGSSAMIGISYAIVFIAIIYMIPRFMQEARTKIRIQYVVFTALIGKLALFVTTYTHGLLTNIYEIVGLMFFGILQIALLLFFVLMLEKGREQQKLRGKMEKIEKLSVISDLAASISHEIRNPLTVTKGFLQLLREPDIPQEKQLYYINLSIDELERAENIISDYLTFARPCIENNECLNLQEELANFMNIIIPYAMIHNVEVSLRATDANIYMYGDREKLQKCFLNVAKNAIEAMLDGGKLMIEVEKVDKQVYISFTDTGVGMDDEQLKRLGTPFYSTKDKGTGLGTMVAYSLAEVMGGKVYVTSSVGKGTTFRFIFPTVKQKNEKVAN